MEKIFSGIEDLKSELPDKSFTIDGRLVGDIGEAIIQRDYDVTLYGGLAKNYDGYTSCGKQVQIKATFKAHLGFKLVPDYYLGIKINRDGSYEEIFNGPGRYILEYFSHRKGVGSELLSFPTSTLKEISAKIPIIEKIKKIKES